MAVLKFQPSTEQEVIALFCSSLHKLGFRMITKLGPTFPDCKAIRKNDGKEVKIEFEFKSSGFNHDPKGCDMIVCWADDTSKPIGPEVIELSRNKMFQALPENPTEKRRNDYSSKKIMRLCFKNKKGLTIAEFKHEINKSHEDYRVSEAQCLIARLIYGKSNPIIKNGRLLIKKMPVFKNDKWAVAKDRKLMKQADILLKEFRF